MKKKAIIAALPISLMASLPVLASSTGTANADVVSAMTTTANDMVATGTAIIPVALTVIGLSMVVTFGIRIFSKVTGARR